MPDKVINVVQFDGIRVGDVNIPRQDIKVEPESVQPLRMVLDGLKTTGIALDEALITVSEQQAKLDAAETTQNELQAKYDKLEKGQPEALASAVKTRLGMEMTAAYFKVDKANDMGDVDLMKAVISSQAKEGKFDFTGKDDTYIKARFDIMAEEAANAGTALVQLQALQAATGPVLDNLADFTHQGAPPTKGREAFMQQSKDAFRSPPGSVTPTVLTKPAPASA